MDIKLYQTPEQIPVLPGRSVVVLMTEDQVPRLDDLLRHLAGMEVRGAVVPNLIHGDQLIASGLAAINLCDLSFAFTCPMDVAEAELHGFLRRKDSYQSLLLFVDGLSADMDRFVTTVDRCAGSRTILGTGVGHSDFQPRPVIFDGDGLKPDHALTVATRQDVQVSAAHGWKSIYGPLVVTRAEKNVLHELNHQPAFEVYQDILARREGVAISAENFLEVCAAYPLGIGSFRGHEVVVRDPIATRDDGAMVIVSSVAEMDTLSIMKGQPDELITSSAQLAAGTLGRGRSRQAILFDCISRVKYLQQRFDEEIRTIHENAPGDDLELFGITSIGEITNVGHDRTRILNKTTLLGAVIDE